MQLFFSHTWKTDTLGRNNHMRVTNFARELRERYGWSVWIDEEQLRKGNIDAIMADGVDACDVFVACITKEYCTKVHAGLTANLTNNDNCAKEWNCAIAGQKIMIPLVLEPLQRWPHGVVTLHLGRCMYVDACSDNVQNAVHNLNEMLLAYQFRPYNKTSNVPRLPPLPQNLKNTNEKSKCWSRESMIDKPQTRPTTVLAPSTPRQSLNCIRFYRSRGRLVTT